MRALPGLGDTLCAIPALRALRRHRAGAHVTVVTTSAATSYWERFPQYVDEIVAFPGWPGLPERRPDVARIPAFLDSMQARQLDLAIQLHGSGRYVNQVVALMGAHRTAGYHEADERPPDGTWLHWREGVSEVRRGLRLMAVLGYPDDDESLEFPLPSDPERVARQLLNAHVQDQDRPFVVIHPGASHASHRWPVERFARVADGLASMGLNVVLTGSQSESRLTAALASRMDHVPLDLGGASSLDELASLLAASTLLVCNDTGVSHLAAALRVPSVVVFTASEQARWAPLDNRLHQAVSGSAEQVLAHARRALRTGSREAA
jgi:ADP-heptose:LPS heptosyltransferase